MLQELSYGYGHLTVHNATTLSWQWEQTGQRNLVTGALERKAGAFLDALTLIHTRN